MIHFLDFDRTLFDTEAYLASLVDEPACQSFADELKAIIAEGRSKELRSNPRREKVWAQVADAIRSGALTFSPGQLEKFLYKDVTEHLRALGNEAIIVTVGDIALQRAKVESALANVVRVTTIYTESKTKAEYLASWPGYYGQEAFFIDDLAPELEALAGAFPNLKLFEIRRDGTSGDSRFTVITSLLDLPS